MLINKWNLNKIFRVVFVACALMLISACTSSGGSPSGGPLSEGSANVAEKITSCKASDTLVASQTQCLQGDASCYQISDGNWCTGERGNVCPAGSTAVAAGLGCPLGDRCFQFSESLLCRI